MAGLFAAVLVAEAVLSGWGLRPMCGFCYYIVVARPSTTAWDQVLHRWCVGLPVHYNVVLVLVLGVASLVARQSAAVLVVEAVLSGVGPCP